MIYRNVTVSIPDNAYINADFSVFVKDRNTYNREKKYNDVKHTVIGRSIGNGLMYPNTNYRLRYPQLFSEASGETIPQQVKRIGLYAVILSIVQKTGLYDVMAQSFGIKIANHILDFTAYSIDSCSCAAENFPSLMKDRLLFSNKLMNTYDLSVLFNEGIEENRVAFFKRKWAEKCKEDGVTDVWIAIDGSNNDCDAVNVEFAEKGKAKSHNSGNIVSYMYAVNAENGLPIAFDVYRGGRVDNKEIVAMIGWLRAFDIRIKGVIVDKGFATADVFELLDDKGGEFCYPYVAMLKGDTAVHNEMISTYGEEIRMNYEYMIGRFQTGEDSIEKKDIQNGTAILYGISSEDKRKIFKSHAYKTYVSLLYDSRNGNERENHLYAKVTNLARAMQRKLDGYGESERKRKKKTNSDDTGINYSKYLSTVTDENERTVVVIDEDAVRKDGRNKGFFTLAHSNKMTAEEANHIYSLRNSAEECFSMIKSQLGYDAERTHYTAGTISKCTIAFIAAIIRTVIVNECIKTGLSTNRMINEMNQLCISMNGKDEYYAVHTENKRQISFLSRFGILTKDLDDVAQTETERMLSPEPNPYHKLPEHTSAEANQEKRKPGRPPGSGVKKKEPKRKKEPKKRGRPPGSKNKKTLEKEAASERGKGRPPGSPNKPKGQKHSK